MKAGSPAEVLKRAQARARREVLELLMLQHLRAERLDAGVVREHVFHDRRLWRFDFAFPASKFAVEVDGGTRSGGRHTRGDGFEADAEKLNEAVLDGWRVLRVTGRQVRSGQAVAWVRRALQGD